MSRIVSKMIIPIIATGVAITIGIASVCMLRKKKTCTISFCEEDECAEDSLTES